LEAPGHFFHVLSRGNARHPIFLDDSDRIRFLDTLGEAVSRFTVRCHAYCLMGNHYHLLLQPTGGTLSRAIRHLNGVYSQRFNRRHGRVGHVFAGRFKSLLVDRDTYLLALSRYIALNPVRSGAVSDPEAWRWSSHSALVGAVGAPEWLTTREVLEAFDARGGPFARIAYARFVAAGMREDHAPHLDALERAANRGGILGEAEFVARFAEALDRRRSEKQFAKRERFACRPALERILAGARTGDLPSRIESARRTHGYSVGEIAKFLGVSRGSIARAARAFSRLEELSK
jgi:REP element-mobilizing transposase RayT